MSTQGAPNISFSDYSIAPAIWFGDELIVWSEGVGGRYNPATNSWSSSATLNAPSERAEHTLIWVGSKMVVWGGVFASLLNTGGIYEPSVDPNH